MNEERKIENISIDTLDDVTGGAPAMGGIKSVLGQEITCPSCGLVNMIRKDIETTKCMRCGASLE